MTHRIRTRARLLTAAVAASLGLAAAAPARGCEDVPSAPLAVNQDVFTGRVKGLLPSGEIIISTKLMNGAFSGFFASASAANVTAFANDPATIPMLRCGDVITLAKGGYSTAYSALEAEWAPGSVVVLPVAAFAGSQGKVTGFVTVEVIEIEGSGNPKYLHGTILALDLAPAA
jgi:hypothetical protein